MRKFYDALLCDGGGGGRVYTVKTENKEASTIIECDCGTHMMKAAIYIEIYHLSDNTQRIRQDIFFAMFNYGNQKRNILGRLVIAWKYLKTGKMFSDQLTLKYSEAKKLSDFISNNVIEENE